MNALKRNQLIKRIDGTGIQEALKLLIKVLNEYEGMNEIKNYRLEVQQALLETKKQLRCLNLELTDLMDKATKWEVPD